MFVGHGVLAFALVARLAVAAGWDRQRALSAGVVAALFATAPDVDIVYALVGLAGSGDPVAGFWAASSVTHRGVTHALTAGAVVAAAVTVHVARPRAGAVLLLAFPATVLALSGPLAAAVAALFVLACAAVARLARRLGFGPRTVLAAALLGLLTHPFGDLLTGGPPPLLYPLDVTLLAGRVAPFADPTLNLLLAFAAELGVLWLGAATYVRLQGGRIHEQTHPAAGLGAAYAAAVPLLAPPTMAVSYHFVFSVLAVGALGLVASARLRRGAVAAAALRRGGRRHADGGRRGRPPAATAVTALSAVTVAYLTYLTGYLLVYTF